MLPALLHFTLESFWYLSYQAYPGSNAHRFLKSDTIHKAKKNAFKMLAASLIGESSKFEVNWVFYFSSVCHREPIKRPPDEADPAQLAETVKVSFFYSCPFVGEFACSKKGRLWLEPRWTDSSETTNIQEILVGSGKRRRKSWRNNRLLVKNYVTHLHGETNDVRDHSNLQLRSSHMHRNIMKDRRVLARKGRPKSDLSAFEFHETRYWQQTLEWSFLPKSQTQRQKISLKWKSVVEDLATGLEKKYVTQTNAQRRFVSVWIPRNEHHHIRPKETAQTD